MKKKITIICCIMIIIFNFIFSSVKVVRADDGNPTGTESSASNALSLSLGDEVNEGSKDILSMLRKNTGKMAVGGVITSINLDKKYNTETQGTIMTTLTKVAVFIVEWANNIPQLAVEATDPNLNLDYFTIYSLVMGEYEFFNLDFFSQSLGTTTTTETSEDASLTVKIRNNIVTFYYILRNLSLGVNIFILIYIGIRMATSTLQIDRVKYKKMFINWLASLVLLLFMQFIIIAVSFLTNEILALLRRLAEVWGISNIEYEIFNGKGEQGGLIRTNLLITPVGFHLLNSLITVSIFVYYQLKFFITYVKRFCEITFLVIVSPLVTITYSIDKIADNKAQAFNTWFQELSVKYAVQVVHAVTYCIFIASAGAIAKEVPLLGALFLLALDKAEKIFRNVLKVNYDGFQKVRVPFFDKKKRK